MPGKRYIIQKVGDRYIPVLQDPHGDVTCAACALGGAALTVVGLHRGGLLGKLAMALGVGMSYRGVTGKNVLAWLFPPRSNPADRQGGSNEAPSYQNDHRQRALQAPSDSIDEASMESFPASDPPARMVNVSSAR